MGSPPPHQPAGNVSTGGAKPSGRLPLPSQASTKRGTSNRRSCTPSGASSAEQRWTSLPLRCQPTAPFGFSLAETTSPLGQDTLAHPWPEGLLSTAATDFFNASESSSRGSQNSAGGPILASEDMVSSPAQTPCNGNSPTEKTYCHN